jgi:hypothetical protein
MQSLLARAVEDQANEQRLVSTTLAEIRAAVDALAGDVLGDQTARRVGELTISLVSQLENVEESLDAMTAQMTAQVTALASGLSALRADQEAGEARTRALVLESEQRVLAHVDDAVYALAKALLPPRKPALAAPEPAPPAPGSSPEPPRLRPWKRSAPVE